MGGHRDGWARLHGGHRPTGIVAAWVDAIAPLARWCARRGITPNAITVVAVVLAVAVIPPARAGGPYALIATALVLISAIADGLDGAVAAIADRATRTGAILDSAGDRLAEAAFAVALWAAGAPGWLAVTAAGLSWLQEYLRARAAAVGVPGIGVITVGERPTRVIATAIGLAAGWPIGPAGPAIGAAVWAALGLIGVVQLTPWLARADRI